MKFLFLSAVFMSGARVFADNRHVSPLDSTHLFPDADFRLEVDAATHSSDTSFARLCNDLADGRVYGKASVFPAFIRKLQQATGKIVNLPEGYSFHDAQVQTLYLTESSPRHVDARMIEGSVPVDREDSDGSLIAFYVHESTANAYFQTDDDELCIPFVEGSAVYFNGGLPHSSIVKSGAVKLVGPFLLSSLESVGVAAAPPPVEADDEDSQEEDGDYMTYLSLTVEGKLHKLSAHCHGSSKLASPVTVYNIENDADVNKDQVLSLTEYQGMPQVVAEYCTTETAEAKGSGKSGKGGTGERKRKRGHNIRN